MITNKYQNTLIEFLPTKKIGVLPSTRYQGSKHKILEWVDFYTKDLKFNSVMDVFGGTGSVSYMFKKAGKQVFYNDYLKFNYYIGKALIENSNTTLDPIDIKLILTKNESVTYPTFIYDTFHDIYFTDEENVWLDKVVTNIARMENEYKQALAYYALFQACIIKRPYNLFHRKNLYVRTADVSRSFGNKKTWDTSFEDHFIKFVEEINNAVFDNNQKNKSFQIDISTDNPPKKVDLVYLDPPYISAKGVGVNYLEFYHFLEGVVSYNEWSNLIDQKSKHKKIKAQKSKWSDKKQIHKAFEDIFEKFKDSIIVVSYRDDGLPTINELVDMLKVHKKSVSVKKIDYKYALSGNSSKEVLIIAE